MVKNRRLLEKFEITFLQNYQEDIEKKFKIFSEMYKFAREMKVFPLKNPLEGIEVDIRLARLINGIPEDS